MENFKIHPSRNEYRQEYLQSGDWKYKRSIILNKDPLCFICDKNKSTDCHHLTYERIGFENLETDLIGVCRGCHNRIHKYELLKSIKNKYELKEIFFKSYKNYVIKENLYNKILELNNNSKLLISGLFKIPISSFSLLKNKQVDYFKMQKIFQLIKSPVKPKKLRFTKKRQNLSYRSYDIRKENQEYKRAEKASNKLFNEFFNEKTGYDILTFIKKYDTLIKELNLNKSKQIAFFTIEKKLFNYLNKFKDDKNLYPVLRDCYLTLKSKSF